MNSRFSRAKKALIGAGAFGAALLAGAMYADARVQSSGTPTYSVANAPSRPVVIVLGARVYANGTPSAALEDRLHCALDLVRSGRARDVIVSGDHGRPDYDEVNAMRAWLVARGVASHHVYMDHAGFRTLDTMARAREVFAVRSALVCTQRFHLARSLWLARAQGIDAAGVVADRRVYPARRFDATREFLARVKAVLDTDVFGTAPRFLGPRVPVGSDATQTHDR
ncbi:MAG: YdcF family protein [Myxococcales bacterium]|nr:YdcF family protein [Myxococcales bacterium]